MRRRSARHCVRWAPLPVVPSRKGTPAAGTLPRLYLSPPQSEHLIEYWARFKERPAIATVTTRPRGPMQPKVPSLHRSHARLVQIFTLIGYSNERTLATCAPDLASNAVVLSGLHHMLSVLSHVRLFAPPEAPTPCARQLRWHRDFLHLAEF
jgi:hypothetical protein